MQPFDAPVKQVELSPSSLILHEDHNSTPLSLSIPYSSWSVLLVVFPLYVAGKSGKMEEVVVSLAAVGLDGMKMIGGTALSDRFNDVRIRLAASTFQRRARMEQWTSSKERGHYFNCNISPYLYSHHHVSFFR